MTTEPQISIFQQPMARPNTDPLRIWASVISVVAVVKVGTICSPSPSVKAFRGSVVVQSNDPVPKPSSWTSCFQMDLSRVLKESSRTRQYCRGNSVSVTPVRRKIGSRTSWLGTPTAILQFTTALVASARRSPPRIYQLPLRGALYFLSAIQGFSTLSHVSGTRIIREEDRSRSN
jgi:hypothetical protein